MFGLVIEETCIGVKQQGGRVGHLQTEIEVSCLPRYLPEYLELDIIDLELGHSLHLSSIALPEGVKIVALAQSEEHDLPVVNIFMPRAVLEEEEEEAAAEEAEPTEGDEAAADDKKSDESS